MLFDEFPRATELRLKRSVIFTDCYVSLTARIINFKIDGKTEWDKMAEFKVS